MLLSLIFNPGYFYGADEITQYLVDVLSLDLGFGGQHDAMPQYRQRNFRYVVRNRIIPSLEGGHCPCALHQGDARSGGSAHVEGRPGSCFSDNLVDVVDQAGIDGRFTVGLSDFNDFGWSRHSLDVIRQTLVQVGLASVQLENVGFLFLGGVVGNQFEHEPVELGLG